jgi:DNA-directed RNA polymerase alpha subunit
LPVPDKVLTRARLAAMLAAADAVLACGDCPAGLAGALAAVRAQVPESFGLQDPELLDALAMPIEDLMLPVRAYNRIRREKITTAGELAELSEYDLLDLYGIGADSVREVKRTLAEIGLELKEFLG